MNDQSKFSSPRRVALYARYSTDMQNPMSIDDQFRMAERYAAQKGWLVVQRFSDGAITGTASYARSDFLRLMEALSDKNRGFDIVIAESLDRISRDLSIWPGSTRSQSTRTSRSTPSSVARLTRFRSELPRSSTRCSCKGCPRRCTAASKARSWAD